MRKNNAYIERMKRVAQAEKHFQSEVNDLVPKVYAAIALALHRTEGFGYGRIQRTFAESQKIWQDSLDDERNMIRICKDETGIDVLNGVNE